ncbi:hypothetical protein AGRHK599_LOCUS1192 [Rhizobium rhizogenes]|uniref:Uncharacterized protein n=1 Tax=Rhizobium rhizogenes TaxID=359 RepID=A0AAN2A1J8_RHIRH|nr:MULTISPECIES: hypothetical protein [Rhizobium/Agrobacterium group]AQS61804.1 hypothetical protein B0909_05725 [Rhizobium rhizogenes]MCZ7442966.1 hypothetical protein [Rhizobium rhizogenes]NSZ78955.1 hypothetical protein [Agrobacterium tumefaciens]OAM65749.1 hypothetical protein A8L48_22400 [Rhizobium rhizogenes]CAD0211167.1 hypothetical protein AGRHK599_LOCUS1192 [Rhizobium rhizogenes]
MSGFQELIDAEFEHNNDGEEFVANVYYGVFDADGFPTAFYCSSLHGATVPADATIITDEQWKEFVDNAGFRKWVDGEVVEYAPPVAPEPATVVYSVDLWSRMTDAEANQVGAEMEQQPFRIRRIFESAGSYRSNHELWPLLQQIATTLFGAERAGEILAPSAVAP